MSSTIRKVLSNSIKDAVAVSALLSGNEEINLKVLEAKNRTGDRIMRGVTTLIAAHKISGEAFSLDQEI